MNMAARFTHAVWLGSGIFLILAAQAAFRTAPNSTAAANLVGAMLSRWHYIALICPLIVLALDWKRARTHVAAIVFLAVVFAATQAMVDLRIRSIRNHSPVPISELSRQDPLRQHFGKLHGVSMMLLLLQVICAAAALGLDREAYPRRVVERLSEREVTPAALPATDPEPPPVPDRGGPDNLSF